MALFSRQGRRFGELIYPPARASKRMDRRVARAARKADIADPRTYDRPATTRMTPGNLGLSIALLVVAAILGLMLFLFIR